MRLSKVKLAGFKSFVDPCTLVLPSQLVGIVGPNGCGKSNVIDAVRWVLGESSARHLRGDSMADVIFNGSTARKPVGQASVELVFDNVDRSLGGPYAEYAEIAIRRQVSRDGESQYYLNGTRCRRRDITDLFLGTGLGPRSYAIIEQGTISRFIEARPEELRLFIEEAAGISRYRERRRETESRMRETQENLGRLGDVRGELERQLEHLGRQARDAERFRTLKAQERTLRAELLALRWRALHRTEREQARDLGALESEHERALATQREVEAALDREREASALAADALAQAQSQYYAAAAEVARLDQSLRHARERETELGAELAQTERRLAEGRERHALDRAELTRLDEASGRDGPALEEARARETLTHSGLEAAEAAVQSWQAAWDHLNERLLAPARAADVEQTRVHHLEQTRGRAEERRQRLQAERNALDPAVLQAALAEAESALAGVEERVGACEAALVDGQGWAAAQRTTNGETARELAEVRNRLQAASGRLASLEALQEEALGKRHGAAAEWLARQGLGDRPRLAEVLEVSEGWERAVEVTLGPFLQAVCVEALGPLDEAAGALSAGAVGLVEAGAGGLGDPGDRDGEGLWLVGRVRGPGVVDSLLAGVRAVDSLPEAGTLRGALATHESVVTRDGLWRGPGWLWVDRTAGADDGVLARERAVRVLVAEREQLAAAVSALVSEQAAGHRLLAELEGRQTTLQSELTVLQRERAAAQTRLGERRGQLEHLRRRAGELDRELAELAGQMESMGADLARAGERLAGARTELQGLEAEREALLAERGPSRARLEEARRQANAARQRAQGLALALEGLRAQRDGLARTAERASHHLEEMEARRGDLAGMVAAARAPLPGLEAAREEALGRQVRVEAELRAARERGEEMEAAVRSLDHRRREAETAAEAERSRCEAARLAQEASRVRLQEVQQAVQQYGTALPRVLESLPEDAIETEWQSRLEGVERRLARLGAINLAAIDEHTQLSERKRYLDAQHEDLVEALGTLEAAIRRMDRETRARFRETYDRVNDSFRGTFPRLLGGGEASLELAGDDLLESGVTVMARPPGKRNTSIHLLSGGEKALTAVALVFAIFQLNPAPFCLLDEVDAPLDDANVGRFCDLVRSMSEQVQFLIVTHNKTTMELADRLVGVTMHEAGVSRLVHVDVDSALEMAAG